MTTTVFTRKERVRRALVYESIDRLPTQINFTVAFGQAISEYFSVSQNQLAEFLDNHIIRLDIDYEGLRSDDGSIRFDWWGVGFDTREEGYLPAVSPMAGKKDLDRYPWPDPHEPALLQNSREIKTTKGDEYFITPNLGFVLFERAWTLRGFEQFLIDLAADSGFAEALLDRIVEIQLVLIHRFLDLGVDGGYFGDDYGAQKNLLISPRMWRSLIKPRLARLFAPFSECGLPIIMHSDGQIQQILPDLIEIGLTTLNPVQPEVMDHVWLRDQYGDRLSFHGGISTQTVLPYGAEEEVITAVIDLIQTLAPEGTGLIIAPSHRMMKDIPLRNIAVLLETFRQSST